MVSRSSFSWLQCLFTVLTHHCGFFSLFLSSSLLSVSTNCFRLILFISCLSPRTSHSSKQPGFLKLANGIGHQDLGATCVCCYLGIIAFRASQLQRKYICKNRSLILMTTLDILNENVYKIHYTLHCVQFSSAQSFPTLCDPMNCSTPGLPVYHQLPEFT